MIVAILKKFFPRCFGINITILPFIIIMNESATIFCEICQIKVEKDVIFHLFNNDSKLKLLDLLPEIDPHLTQNSVICDQCFTQMTDTQELEQSQVKGVPSNNSCKELNEILINHNTICIKEEPGIENSFTQIIDTQLEVKNESNVNERTQQDVPCNINFNKPDPNCKEVHVNDNTICVKEEAGVEKIKEEFNVSLINDSQTIKDDFFINIDDKKYYCHDCGCCTDTKQKLIQHIYKQHRKKDLMRKSSSEKIYQCNKCHYKCAHRSRFNKHKLYHVNEKRYRCTQCKYSCNRRSLLRGHMINHISEYPFQCNKCDYRSIYKSHLKVHILAKHSDEKPYQCDKCDYKCVSKSILKNHTSQHTGEKPYQCDKCDYKCVRRDKLTVHELSHTGEYPFHCDQCDYKCAYKRGLKIHKFSHTNKKRYMCTQCECGYSDIRGLKNHMIKHTGEFPFQCDKCDYKCGYKARLKMHIVSEHAGETPYQCDKCDFKCAYKTSLRTHKFSHTNEKPYVCTQCKCGYKNRIDLKSHMITHTVGFLFQCNKCDYKCIRKRHFKSHMLSKHTDPSNTAITQVPIDTV